MNIGDSNSLIQYVNERAPQFGLDPAAVLSIAKFEGMGGGIGDGGHAYGPWQDHLTDFQGRPWYGKGTNNQQVQQWAWSTDGIDYVLGQMSGVAKNLSGRDAISAIVTGYERSADQPGEIKNAWGVYSAYNNGLIPDSGSTTDASGTLASSAALVEQQSQSSEMSAPTLFGNAALGKIVSRVASPGFWWSVGFVLLALILIVAGLVIYFRRDLESAAGRMAAAA